MSRERFVVHPPVLAMDLAGARGFARAICRALNFLADGGRRCPLPADHDRECGSGGRR